MTLADMGSLFDILRKVDGKPYGRFRDIRGSYDAGKYTLHMDSVQGSPSSGPTEARVTASMRSTGFPEDTYSSGSRRTALADLMARRFWESSRTHSRSISFPRPGQEILERGSVRITEDRIELSFRIDLPNAGKNAAGKTAAEMFRKLDTVIEESMFFASYKRSKLYNHIETSENADHARSVLRDMGMVSFICNGSVLPRREDGLAPLSDAMPFEHRGSDATVIDVPNGGPWTGLGIKEGLTVLAGVTGSGRSSILDAVFSGVHNHIPGDGRERVVTVDDAVFISKQTRPALNVDASSFIRGCNGMSSDLATGPYGESAAMSEAAETGCRLFMMDEDTSTPSVICRDRSIRDITDQEEPVIPVSDLMHGFRAEGISVIMVGSRDGAISVADRVLLVSGGRTSNIDSVDGPRSEENAKFSIPSPRYPAVLDRNGPLSPSCLSDLRMARDTSYEDSVRSSVSDLRDMMDGTYSIQELAFRRVKPRMEHVRVRPIDVAMAIGRCKGLSMIRKT